MAAAVMVVTEEAFHRCRAVSDWRVATSSVAVPARGSCASGCAVMKRLPRSKGWGMRKARWQAKHRNQLLEGQARLLVLSLS